MPNLLEQLRTSALNPFEVRRRRAEEQAKALQAQLATNQPQPVSQPQSAVSQPVVPQGLSQAQIEAIRSQLGGLEEQATGLQTNLAGIQQNQTSEASLNAAEEAIKAAQKKRLEAEVVGPEESETEQTLRNLLASEQLGLQAVREKPIALPFITGQQKALEARVAAQSMPLQARLAGLQAKRQAAIGSAKLGKEEAESLREIEKARFERRKPEKESETEKTRGLKTKVIKRAFPELSKSRGADGYVSPQVYQELRRQYAEAVGDPTGFDDIFSPMLSPQERARLFTEKSVPAARASESEELF